MRAKTKRVYVRPETFEAVKALMRPGEDQNAVIARLLTLYELAKVKSEVKTD